MDKQYSYTEILKAISKMMDHRHFDAFKASLIVAYIADLPKEKALDDLIELRTTRA